MIEYNFLPEQDSRRHHHRTKVDVLQMRGFDCTGASSNFPRDHKYQLEVYSRYFSVEKIHLKNLCDHCHPE